MSGLVGNVVRRDLLLAMRQKSDVLNTLFFFVVVVTLVPLGVGPEPNLLRAIAPGVVWVAALLAAMLSLPRLFANDYADGTLEQMLLSAEPLPLIVLGKAVAHWLVTGLPLTVVSLVFGVMFNLGTELTLVMAASLLVGTPVLSLIGAVGAALTLGVRGGGVLTSLLVLPLYIPVLIFGAGAVEASAASIDSTAYFLIVGAIFLFSAALTPWAVAAALRVAAE
ncbi:MAG TPA: heme exporter protein CcmB [Burkholderiaceae bacterium]|nr:heme exporter protein CcmB [Burkholderiaceae bacterium]HRZ01283.1 heme exporter protein CcmB [Burkholderiaceae bacterium]